MYNVETESIYTLFELSRHCDRAASDPVYKANRHILQEGTWTVQIKIDICCGTKAIN